MAYIATNKLLGSSPRVEECLPKKIVIFQVDKGFIYSDISREVDDIATGNPKASTKPLDLIPPEVVFLQVDDAWVNGVRVRITFLSVDVVFTVFL